MRFRTKSLINSFNVLNVSFVCFLSSLHVLQITIPSLDREEVLVPGDLAGEDPHLVDEVKKGWRRWTFDL